MHTFTACNRIICTHLPALATNDSIVDERSYFNESAWISGRLIVTYKTFYKMGTHCNSCHGQHTRLKEGARVFRDRTPSSRQIRSYAVPTGLLGESAFRILEVVGDVLDDVVGEGI